MSGSDKIIEKILSDARIEAEAVKDEAKIRADETLNAARQRSEEDLAAKKAEADRADGLKRENADSGAALIVRNMLLTQRRAEIDETKALMLKKLTTLPTDEYFDVLLQLAKRDAMDGKGVMFLSPFDLERAPQSFKDALKSISGGITAEPSDKVKDGFILRYGDIEQNCGFEAMMADRADRVEDFINKELF